MTTVNSDSSKLSAADCADGELALGVGWQQDAGGQVAVDQINVGRGGVSVSGTEDDNGYDGNWGITATAICATTEPEVPHIYALPSAAASERIAAAGLTPSADGTIMDPTCEHLGRVASQSPEPGTLVAPGSTVRFKVWAKPPKCRPNPL